MPNVFDYIKWRGDISFNESGINEIDALIFSELSYASFDDLVSPLVSGKGISLASLAKKYFSMHYDRYENAAIIPLDNILALLKSASETNRFASVAAKGFVNEVDIGAQKQFCAVSFDVCKDITVVAFRGTDDTIVGWKEDLNMAFFTPIPAQTHAKEYLEYVVDRNEGKRFVVCGHSKGGNLATYAALLLSEEKKEKIISVYNFDGPGFKSDFVEAQKDNSIASKLNKIAPQGSIIGAIFDSVEGCRYVKSNAKGLYQHDAFSWQLTGKSFEYVDKPSKSSVNFHDILNSWVSKMTDCEQVEFVDALYTLLTVNDATTLSDIVSDKFKFLVGILKVDEKTKKTFVSFLNRLVKEKYFKRDKKSKE